MKIPKRSIRRHNREMLNKKVAKQIKFIYHLNPVVHQKLVKHMVKNRTLCSCWMCGNPRKYFNHKTIQEERNEDYDYDDENNS